MLFTRTLSMGLLVSAIIQTATVGQVGPTPILAETAVSALKQAPSERLTRSSRDLTVAEESDSLLAQRKFFSTTVRQQGNRLNRRSIIEVMEDIPQAQTLYRRSQLLKPIGPLLIASGLVIGYMAVKGTPKTTFAKGIGTSANPSPPDVLVDYTSRSLPTLMGGIGLLVGGLCLIEISNGMTAKAINLYNAQVVPHRSISRLQTIELGITDGGNVGLEAKF
ncbi:hypothetical protein [Spirosoma validum]|uniref:Uncharacterized protein n=1 Tax=Spirosoma validum TaxID=2771355 RepID=A0A927AZH9_9BACT|nr:hypothetical protein [Spirosoma validum]MBD2752598.1 hypothetical protein [Spirosoma validum]